MIPIMPNEPFIMPNEPMIMNPNPQLEMRPVGSLNIPRWENTLSGRTYQERRYEPPIKFEMPKVDIPKYIPKTYEPPKFDLFPKKNFWDK